MAKTEQLQILSLKSETGNEEGTEVLELEPKKAKVIVFF